MCKSFIPSIRHSKSPVRGSETVEGQVRRTPPNEELMMKHRQMYLNLKNSFLLMNILFCFSLSFLFYVNVFFLAACCVKFLTSVWTSVSVPQKCLISSTLSTKSWSVFLIMTNLWNMPVCRFLILFSRLKLWDCFWFPSPYVWIYNVELWLVL